MNRHIAHIGRHTLLTSKSFVGAKVDREKRQILGFVVTSIGPALGHGESIDEESLRQVVALGNGGTSPGGPIRARMDHPPRGDMTVENPLSKLLGRPINFRIDGTRVIADLQLLSASAAPESDRLLDLAAEAPDLFGASLVFDYAEPEIHMAAVKKGKKPPVRFSSILAVDFVDLPATNPSGLFSTSFSKERLMAKLSAYVRNGGLFCNVGGDEYELELPDEAMAGAKGKHAAAAGTVGGAPVEPVQVEKAIADAVKAEREYNIGFHTAMTTAGMKDKEADDFKVKFYGRPLEDVKQICSYAIGARAKPVGEGGGGDETQTPEQKKAKADAEFTSKCEADFCELADGKPRYAMFGIGSKDDAGYKPALQRFINHQKNWKQTSAPATTVGKA